MRKKSHILLASYLVKDIQQIQLRKHKKAFILGSILPDCKPSFLTTKHEFFGTFEMIQNRIGNLSTIEHFSRENQRAYIRQVGEVIHYMADYFTFPHNKTYSGTLKDHCSYEKELKFGLRAYLKGDSFKEQPLFSRLFYTKEDLFCYIKEMHKSYLNKIRNVEEDCVFIVHVCRQVLQAIFQIANQKNYDFVKYQAA